MLILKIGCVLLGHIFSIYSGLYQRYDLQIISPILWLVYLCLLKSKWF